MQTLTLKTLKNSLKTKRERSFKLITLGAKWQNKPFKARFFSNYLPRSKTTSEAR